jgi:hypothetical protein
MAITRGKGNWRAAGFPQISKDQLAVPAAPTDDPVIRITMMSDEVTCPSV